MSELKAIGSVFNIEIEKIDPNPDQPRKHFSQESLNDLAESIRRYGVMQPITVVRRESGTPDGGMTTRYEIIAGERRWRASVVAGMASIPAIVREAEETEQERFELSILENLQREDLNPVDKARSFARLADEFDMKHAEIADKLGKSREYVTNALRLLALPDNVLDGLSDGEISEGHTRPLLTLKDKPDELQVLFSEIKTKGLTVREAEKTARELSGGGRKTSRYNSNQPLLDPEMESLQTELAKSLGTTVSIDKKEKGGKLTIDFFSREDLKKLLSMVGANGMADIVAEQNVEHYDENVIEKPVDEVVVTAPTEQENTVTVNEFVNVKGNGTETQDSIPETQIDEPVILNEYIVPKSEAQDDVLGENLVQGKEQEAPEVEINQVSHTDTVDLVGSSAMKELGENTTAENSHSVKFDDGFTITPQATGQPIAKAPEQPAAQQAPGQPTAQVHDVVLDESLAHKDIVTQSAHKTEVQDRGVGINSSPDVVQTVQNSSRAKDVQAEIDALVGMTDVKDLEYDGQIVPSNEPKHLDLGEMELHEPEFRKEEPIVQVKQESGEDTMLSAPVHTESGAIVDSVFTSSDDFVPKQPTPEPIESIDVAGSDFAPNGNSNQGQAQVTMGGLGGGNLKQTAPEGPSVTEKYPAGDPYRLDNFSL